MVNRLAELLWGPSLGSLGACGHVAQRRWTCGELLLLACVRRVQGLAGQPRSAPGAAGSLSLPVRGPR